MTWTFIWLMLLLKIPIGGMLWIVWWAIKKADEEPVAEGEHRLAVRVEKGRRHIGVELQAHGFRA